MPQRAADALQATARDAYPIAFLRQPAVYDDLAHDELFAGAFVAARTALRRDGARATVAALLGG